TPSPTRSPSEPHSPNTGQRVAPQLAKISSTKDHNKRASTSVSSSRSSMSVGSKLESKYAVEQSVSVSHSVSSRGSASVGSHTAIVADDDEAFAKSFVYNKDVHCMTVLRGAGVPLAAMSLCFLGTIVLLAFFSVPGDKVRCRRRPCRVCAEI